LRAFAKGSHWTFIFSIYSNITTASELLAFLEIHTSELYWKTVGHNVNHEPQDDPLLNLV
jgi:hypothetical protein